MSSPAENGLVVPNLFINMASDAIIIFPGYTFETVSALFEVELFFYFKFVG